MKFIFTVLFASALSFNAILLLDSAKTSLERANVVKTQALGEV